MRAFLLYRDPINFKGVRVPLEILPHTGTTLPVPVVSPTPAAP
jgi:hypothetical protein